MNLFANSSIWILLMVCCLSYACEETAPEKKFRVGFVQCCDDPWRDVMNSEMYRELELHPELDFEMRVSGNDSKKQIEQIRELVASGIDILIVSPNESKPLTPIIPSLVPVLFLKIGAVPVFGIFAFMMVLQLIVVWRMMPETKGISLEALEAQMVRREDH